MNYTAARSTVTLPDPFTTAPNATRFATNAPDPTEMPDAAEIYSLIRRTEMNPNEVEDTDALTVEVTVLWKASILHVAHIETTQGFVLATSGRIEAGAGFIVDESMLPAGLTTAPVVTPSEQGPRFVFLPQGAGSEEIDGTRNATASLIASGAALASSIVAGAYETAMRAGAKYRVQVGGLTVLARVVAKARKVVMPRKRDRGMALAGAGALLAVASLIGAMKLNAGDSSMLSQTSDEDRLAEIREFVNRVNDRQLEQQNTGSSQGAAAASHNERPAETSGRAGRPNAAQRNGRTAVAQHSAQPQIGRPPSRENMRSVGVFAALDGMHMASSDTGFVSPFGAMGSGTDARDAIGTGGDLGDGQGIYGLGPSGPGVGGGGNNRDTIVGGGPVTTLSGRCEAGHACRGGTSGTLRDPGPRGPRVATPIPPTVVGIDPEVIRRVVRRNLAQISHCHEQGLSVNPQLQGRVVVQFVIGSGGTVLGSAIRESTVSVPSVNTCISNAVRRWTFDVPQDLPNAITVSYPFVLQPAD